MAIARLKVKYAQVSWLYCCCYFVPPKIPHGCPMREFVYCRRRRRLLAVFFYLSGHRKESRTFPSHI